MKKIILFVLVSSVLTLATLGIFMTLGWDAFVGGSVADKNGAPSGAAETADKNGAQNNAAEQIVLDGSAAFVAVHMEAGARTKNLEYQKTFWPTLISLVSAADKYGVKLTLEFNPQWAEYILQDDAKLTQLRGWETAGHEIALHHHGPTHADWNGYTNRTDKKNDPNYRGTIEEMMAIVNRLPASGQILTEGGTDRETDWPQGVIYKTEGGGDKNADLISKPQNETWNGQNVLGVSHIQYATGMPVAISLDEIKSGLDSLQDGEVLGVVFHEKDYKDRAADIEKLFSLLKERGVAGKTVKQILGGARTGSGEIDGATAKTNPLNVFYVMHVEPNYGTESEQSQLPQSAYNEIKNTVLKATETLEKHGMKGNFEVVYRVAKDAETYEGSDNFITQLKKRGHLVGLHSHHWMIMQSQKNCDSLCEDGCASGANGQNKNACFIGAGSVEENLDVLKKMLGVSSIAAMGFRSYTWGYEFARAADLGAKIVNDNYSPGDKFASWSKDCQDFGYGENNVWNDTGNLMHPWRPNYQKGLSDFSGGTKDLCKNNPNGKIVYIDQVVGDWITASSGGSSERHTLGTADFDVLRKYFAGAMRNLSIKQINVWGWPQHENEYRTNLDGDYNSAAIAALDKFLTELDGYKEKGYIKYATLEEIYNQYVGWERAQ